ncbi:protransforming growth factor alpha, partial [Pyrgilauda ruficollis]|uniref:protransforming growth factor alpha n=1 Tax=Pyrgilauda ruficollis TaxID=221976 RepID=UPI001B861BCF
PVAAAVRSHFNECPDSHRQFCFHGTCRFLVQEEKPACVCHSGYVGTRATRGTCHSGCHSGCCRLRKRWPCPCPCPCPGWCREPGAGAEKPGGLLKGGASCCHSETGG